VDTEQKFKGMGSKGEEIKQLESRGHEKEAWRTSSVAVSGQEKSREIASIRVLYQEPEWELKRKIGSYRLETEDPGRSGQNATTELLVGCWK